MGYDVYCPFCAAAFGSLHIEDEPRSDEFRRAIQVPGCNAHDDDSSIPEAERHDYDRDLVNEQTTEWMTQVYVIWIDPNTKEPSFQGPFENWDYGFFDGPGGSDIPNHPEGFDRIRGYHFEDAENDDPDAGVMPVVPFHLSCWKIFAAVKFGSPDAASKIGKAMFYEIIKALTPYLGRRPESIDYGDPAPLEEQFFQQFAGEEFLVYDPGLISIQSAKGLIRDRLQSSTFDLDREAASHVSPAASGAQGRNPATTRGMIGRLPYDIIYNIAVLLPLKSAISLAGASRQLQAWLHNGAGVWKRMAFSSMPWFVELHELMQEEPDVFTNRNLNMKKALLWLDHATTGKPFLTGPFMAVANRRRVWTTCEQLADIWLGFNSGNNRKEREIRTASKSIQRETFASWVSSSYGSPINHFWVKSWEDISSGERILETFWDSEGFLLGMALTVDGNRRVAGGELKPALTNEAVIKREVEIASGEWIAGFVVHLPPFDLSVAVAGKRTKSSPRGIELVLTSGNHVIVGDAPSTSWKRAYLAPDGWRITGIVGADSPAYAYQDRMLSMGLLVAPQPEAVGLCPKLPDTSPLAVQLWKGNIDVCGWPIWNHPTLELIAEDEYSGQSFPRSLTDFGVHKMPQEALIWGHNMRELSCVARISACIVPDNRHDQDVYVENAGDIIVGFTVEFTPESGISPRSIGTECVGRACNSLDIDGRGGERIVQIQLGGEDGRKRAVRIETNRGRGVEWRGTDDENIGWASLPAPKGKQLVGLVASFKPLKISSFNPRRVSPLVVDLDPQDWGSQDLDTPDLNSEPEDQEPDSQGSGPQNPDTQDSESQDPDPQPEDPASQEPDRQDPDSEDPYSHWQEDPEPHSEYISEIQLKSLGALAIPMEE